MYRGMLDLLLNSLHAPGHYIKVAWSLWTGCRKIDVVVPDPFTYYYRKLKVESFSSSVSYVTGSVPG